MATVSIFSMMRTLLFSAKLKFAHGEESSMVEKCDTYLSRVDLLKLFVANNCADIPSIQELAQAEKARYCKTFPCFRRNQVVLENGWKGGWLPSNN